MIIEKFKEKINKKTGVRIYEGDGRLGGASGKGYEKLASPS